MNAIAVTPLPLAEQHRLILANVGLVWHLARKAPSALPIEDRVAEGMVGIVIAAQRFDPSHGVIFGTYASHWIRCYILNACMRRANMGRGGSSSRMFFRLAKAVSACEAAGLEPTNERIAGMIDVGVEMVADLREHVLKGEVSMQAFEKDDDGKDRRLEAMFGLSCAATQERDHDANERATALRSAIDVVLERLPPRERDIVEQRHLADEPLTLQQVGDRWGLSRERIRQLETRAMKKLTRWLASMREET